MSLLNFESHGPLPKGQKKSLKIVLGVGALVGVIALGSTLAASINLNSGAPVEFGQGVTQTTACDDEVKVTPISSFSNDEESGFNFTAITLSDLDGTPQTDPTDKGCAGKTFTIKSYDSSGNLLTPTYLISLASNGSFSSPDGSTDGNETEGDSDSSVKLTFDSPSIDAESVYRITIESSSDASLSNLQNRIAAGWSHTCALTATEGVKCWGANHRGQLGDGTGERQLEPVLVSGLITGVEAIDSGVDHTCALLNSGAVKCWGWNSFGQVGDQTQINRSTPVSVFGLSSGVVAIATGGFHTCAIFESGGVGCWGFNDNGQLGDGTDIDRSTPVPVFGLSSGVVAITAGGYHTCALLSSGEVKCWGLNYQGQLGDGTNDPHLTPVTVSGMNSEVATITAGGFHTCVLLNSGAAKCWGSNFDGQLGDGTDFDRSTPVAVDGLSSGVEAITLGAYHSCALIISGAVKCWGYNNTGQLGDGTEINRSTPVAVDGLSSGVAAISAGVGHTCALLNSGGINCWGYGADGQLGDGTQNSHSTPVDVVGLT